MASTIGSLAAQAINSGDLVDLVSSSSTTTIYPSDDAILSALHSRFRADLPYTRIGASNLVVVNPYKTLANVNDLSAKEYEDRCYKDTSLPLVDSPKPLQPHVYELAAKIYLLMRRRNESQSIITRWVPMIHLGVFVANRQTAASPGLASRPVVACSPASCSDYHRTPDVR
jgi:chitin synthase